MAWVQFCHAASFQSFDQSASSIGYAYADRASLAEDASTNWHNPAGIARFDCAQVSVGAANVHSYSHLDSFIYLDTTLPYPQPEVSASIYGPMLELYFVNLPPTIPASLVVPRAKGDSNQVYPFAHVTYPVIRNWRKIDIALGLSVASPWNWDADYANTDVVSYANRMQIHSVAIAPTVALRAYKMLSAAFQLRWERISWHQSSESIRLFGIDYSLKSSFLSYNGSFLWQFAPFFRLGGTYAFNTRQHLEGTSNLYFTRSRSTMELPLPNTLTLGFSWDTCSYVTLTGTILYTGWSRLKQIDIRSRAINGYSDPITSSIPYRFKDAYMTALGLRYCASEVFTLRTGFGYETPTTRNIYREFKFQDAAKYRYGIGFNYLFNDRFSADFGYLFTYCPKNTVLNQPFIDYEPDIVIPPEFSTTSYPFTTNKTAIVYDGTAKNQFHTFGIQLNSRF